MFVMLFVYVTWTRGNEVTVEKLSDVLRGKGVDVQRYWWVSDWAVLKIILETGWKLPKHIKIKEEKEKKNTKTKPIEKTKQTYQDGRQSVFKTTKSRNLE